jgi:hypothetical protein
MTAPAHRFVGRVAFRFVLFAMLAAEALPFGHRAFAAAVATSLSGLFHDDLLCDAIELASVASIA